MVSSKTGKIKKATGDFAVRKGVTQKPLADIDFYGEIFSNATFSSVLVSQALQYLLVKMLTEVK